MKNSTLLPIIAALDEIPPDQILTFINEEIPEISIVKIGLEVFNLTGKPSWKSLKIFRIKNIF